MSFFRQNRARKVRKRCSHSRFGFQVVILVGFFHWNVALGCSCFSVAMGDHAIFVESSNDARWKISQAEKEEELKSYKPLQALILSPAPLLFESRNPIRRACLQAIIHLDKAKLWKSKFPYLNQYESCLACQPFALSLEFFFVIYCVRKETCLTRG